MLFGHTGPPGATQMDERVGKSQDRLHLLRVNPDRTATQQEVNREPGSSCWLLRVPSVRRTHQDDGGGADRTTLCLTA